MKHAAHASPLFPLSPLFLVSRLDAPTSTTTTTTTCHCSEASSSNDRARLTSRESRASRPGLASSRLTLRACGHRLKGLARARARAIGSLSSLFFQESRQPSTHPRSVRPWPAIELTAALSNKHLGGMAGGKKPSAHAPFSTHCLNRGEVDCGTHSCLRGGVNYYFLRLRSRLFCSRALSKG